MNLTQRARNKIARTFARRYVLEYFSSGAQRPIVYSSRKMTWAGAHRAAERERDALRRAMTNPLMIVPISDLIRRPGTPTVRVGHYPSSQPVTTRPGPVVAETPHADTDEFTGAQLVGR